jgi:chromosome segregation ATPase
MRITSVHAEGALSFDSFNLDLDSRLTVVVGPNGAGKSNLVPHQATFARSMMRRSRSS